MHLLALPLSHSLKKEEKKRVGGRKALCVEAGAHSSSGSHCRGGDITAHTQRLVRIQKKKQPCHRGDRARDGEMHLLRSTPGRTRERAGTLTMNSSVSARPLLQLPTEERVDAPARRDRLAK